ncbi:hypothetical protein AAG895_17895 [Thauera sp. JM12B12]|uniref:hypothetical protein n=1 Tax=Thauera sp. JM12B12 TaxID=3142262 RepID=UPI0031F3CA21
MSTTTVSMRSTSIEATLEDVREREASARAAARTAQLNERIAGHETHLQAVIRRLDEASVRLPDLNAIAPAVPSFLVPQGNDPDVLERFADRMAQQIEAFSSKVDEAIKTAEGLLARRKAKAAAWRTIADHEEQLRLQMREIMATASELGLSHRAGAIPERPAVDDELESVERHALLLERLIRDLAQQQTDLDARLDARRRASSLAGGTVVASNAGAAQERHDAKCRNEARHRLQESLDMHLTAAGLNLADLPASTRGLITHALAHSHEQDLTAQVKRWVSREQHRRRSTQRAIELMQRAPELLQDSPDLSRRWSSLVIKLQRIAEGTEEMSPSIEREFDQLGRDARRNLKTALAKADWVKAMRTQGFEVLQRDDDGGLVVVDLSHPEVWLEAQEFESPDGGYATELELKTDASSSAELEEKLTTDVCHRLAQAAAPERTGDVHTESEVIEHERRIKRARRPAAARNRFASEL